MLFDCKMYEDKKIEIMSITQFTDPMYVRFAPLIFSSITKTILP